MRAKAKDKAKKQRTRPTELAAISAVLDEARQEGVSLRQLILRNRANAEQEPASVFRTCQRLVSRFELKQSLLTEDRMQNDYETSLNCGRWILFSI